jgi:hypothetical protein
MTAEHTVYVDCLHEGKVIRTYDFLCPATLGPTLPPSDETLIKEAKVNLSNERLAAPPFDRIEFKVRR